MFLSYYEDISISFDAVSDFQYGFKLYVLKREKDKLEANLQG